MGVFAANALDYAAHGLPAFPVDTREKRPLVRGWQRAGVKASRQWAERFPDADGLGIVCGPRTGITEVDVDAVGNAVLGAAIERFGETPVVIRTASGKAKLWYRHNGEGRRILKLDGLPIDVLGAGCTIAPPSYRTDLGAAYRFILGGLDDLNHLQPIKANALDAPEVDIGRPASDVWQGERNRVLWRFCMVEARACDNVEALIDCAETFAAAMPDPLGSSEIERAARSAWRYETTVRNFVGLKRPQAGQKDRTMETLSDAPEAYYLLDVLQRFHRPGKVFAIAPTAMARDGLLPWRRSRIERARNILIERGFLETVSPPRRGHQAGRYRLLSQMPKMSEDHYTPSPSSQGA